jgi:hypothetical protein
MEVVGIFGTEEDILCSVQFHDPTSEIEAGEAPDALSQLYNEWNDSQYLSAFFKQYEKDFRNQGRTEPLRKAVINARNEGRALLTSINELAINHNAEGLSDLFKPLADEDDRIDPSRLKAYGDEYKSYMRVYAVKHNDVYYITGGAIKLTQKIQGRDHTETELHKMNLFRDFLGGDAELLQFYITP